MKIMVAGLVHDRPAWPCWLRHLDALEAGEHELLRLHVVDAMSWGYSNDGDTDWCPIPKPRLMAYLPGEGYRRQTAIGRNAEKDRQARAIFGRMAQLRNAMIEAALEAEVDALVNIDSDIMAPTDLILRLAEANCPWVSAIVQNNPSNPRQCNILALYPSRTEKAAIVHVRPRPDGGNIATHWPSRETYGLTERPTLVVGAACWYSANMLRAGVRFKSHLLQEDVGFGLSARRRGYDGRYIGLRCEHLMRAEDLARHRRECELCRSV
ncbi:MAG: hypothetical protein AMJ84_03685 [Acidithiobacillales bacterium SM23_46]|nr:MAG: hypothetical protein AMJ84_03685 [Acidithiobacillales bacterium SM23_46]